MRPRPSDDPVMNTRATSHLLSPRRPFRLTIPNALPASRVLPCTRHDAGERVYTIQEEEGRPEEQHLQHRFRAEPEIYRASRAGWASAIAPSARAWQAWPSNKQEALI